MIYFLSKQRFKIYVPTFSFTTLPNNTSILLRAPNEFYNQQYSVIILIQAGKFILTIFHSKICKLSPEDIKEKGTNSIHKRQKFNKPCLEKTTVFQIILDNDISDGIKHKLNIIRVCCTCEVGVNFLRIFLFVQILKLQLYICSCLFIIVFTCFKME